MCNEVSPKEYYGRALRVNPRFRVFAAMALVILTGYGAASSQTKPNTSKPPVDSSATVASSAPEKAPIEGVGVAVDPNKYVIGPEDILLIKTWREPDFTLPVVVRPDGKITMPLIGEVEATNLSPQQLTTNIKEQLGKYMTNPDVNVFVQEVRSKKYYIDGEVNRPGPYPLITPIRVFEALSNANGFKDFANQKDVRILHSGKIFHFNYKDVTKGKHLDQNIYIENGDHIIVR